FVFFPRVPGPLWDIGLSLGLPLALGLEPSNQGLGVSTRLKPGQGGTQTGVAESAPVLVAEFENWVPPTSLLYWRGPVYYDFDGTEWRLDAAYEKGQGRALMRQGWSKAAAFTAQLARVGQPVRYTLRLTPHERLWLYALDLPGTLAAESFVSADWQVLAHRPVRTEMRYTLTSHLEWEAGGTLAEATRNRALALPERGNPRLRAQGAELARLPDTAARLKAALATLARGGYQVRDRFDLPAGANLLDAFWFDTRVGNADLFAGSLVFLMRAAGVPARLVTGYRGGKLMALTDYVIVKKNHAHAWAEIWDTQRGWLRVDPVDLVAPERFASGRNTARKTAATQEKRPEKTPEKTAAATPRPNPPAPEFAPRAPDPRLMKAPTASGWSLPDPGAFLGRWIFRLDGETQRGLVAGVSDRFAWLWLCGFAAVSVTCLFALRLLLARALDARRLPPPERDWRRILRLLAQRGFVRAPGECPRAFARRVGMERPLLAEDLVALATAWDDSRYARQSTDAPRRARLAARRLYNLILAEN
ncbi:MAG: transglutaminaseTgpA domain-containing protein, partial [Zoogloeaceae bacterium]|nr:transglutaminaseTgpA domain-containing protein [Zoogloeaceae bacterium]